MLSRIYDIEGRKSTNSTTNSSSSSLSYSSKDSGEKYEEECKGWNDIIFKELSLKEKYKYKNLWFLQFKEKKIQKKYDRKIMEKQIGVIKAFVCFIIIVYPGPVLMRVGEVLIYEWNWDSFLHLMIDILMYFVVLLLIGMLLMRKYYNKWIVKYIILLTLSYYFTLICTMLEYLETHVGETLQYRYLNFHILTLFLCNFQLTFYLLHIFIVSFLAIVLFFIGNNFVFDYKFFFPMILSGFYGVLILILVSYFMDRINKSLFVSTEKTRIVMNSFTKMRKRQKQLIANMIPKGCLRIVNEMNRSRKNQQFSSFMYEKLENMIFIYSDLVEFTTFSLNKNCDEIVTVLDCLYTKFDKLSKQFSVEKFCCIGDAWLGFNTCKKVNCNSARHTILFGLSLIEITTKHSSFKLKIGISKGFGYILLFNSPNRLSMTQYGETLKRAALCQEISKPNCITIDRKSYNDVCGTFSFDDCSVVPQISTKNSKMENFVKDCKSIPFHKNLGMVAMTCTPMIKYQKKLRRKIPKEDEKAINDYAKTISRKRKIINFIKGFLKKVKGDLKYKNIIFCLFFNMKTMKEYLWWTKINGNCLFDIITLILSIILELLVIGMTMIFYPIIFSKLAIIIILFSCVFLKSVVFVSYVLFSYCLVKKKCFKNHILIGIMIAFLFEISVFILTQTFGLSYLLFDTDVSHYMRLFIINFEMFWVCVNVSKVFVIKSLVLFICVIEGFLINYIFLLDHDIISGFNFSVYHFTLLYVSFLRFNQ